MNGIYWYNCIDKSKKHKGNLWMIAVVPRAGTWIETAISLSAQAKDTNEKGNRFIPIAFSRKTKTKI